jgi:hypothetical protein
VWRLPGDADIVLIWPTEEGAHVRVIDIKRTAEEKTYHRIQTACYGIALSEIVDPATVGEGVRLVDRATDRPADIEDMTDEEVTVTLIDQLPDELGDELSAIRTQHGGTLPDTLLETGLNEVVTISTGVITQDSELDKPTPDTLPRFDDTYHRVEIQQLCAPEGELQDLWKTATQEFEAVDYQLEQKCADCPYNEACFTDAAQEGSPRLLGLSPGEVHTLAEHDIESLEDLAGLCYPPESDRAGADGWWPANFDVPQVRDNETYMALSSNPGIGDRLPEIVYRAQSLLGVLGNQGLYAHTGRAPWLPRVGYGSLPDDDPAGGFDLDTNPRHELIRVYLNVQGDHLRDRLLQLSARVSATDSPLTPEPISSLAHSAPDDPDQKDTVERELLVSFVEDVFGQIRRVANSLDNRGSADAALVHFYLFDGSERTMLQEAIERHSDHDSIAAFRRLLDGRAGADQPMVSQVRSDAQRRLALKTPSPGLLHLWDQLYAPEEALPRHALQYEPDDTAVAEGTAPEEVQFQAVFGPRLFNREVVRGDYTDNGTDYAGNPVRHAGPELFPGEVPSYQTDDIGLRVRYGAQIPLSYLWSAIGRIDEAWVESFEREYGTRRFAFDAYRYHDPDEREYRIRRADVEALGTTLVDALRHVERALEVKSSHVYDDQKEPLPLQAFSSQIDAAQPAVLAAGARDYLGMEYEASRTDTYSHYRKPVHQRVLRGKTLPVELTTVEELDDDGSRARVDGELVHARLGFENPDRIARSCRFKDNDGSTSGSWVVVSPNPEGQTRRPYELERATAGTIETLDLTAGEVTIEVAHRPGASEFSRHHHGWTTDPDEADDSTLYLREGDIVWVDPQTDSVTADRAATALDHAQQNHLHELLEAIRNGHVSHPQTGVFEEGTLTEWADWLATGPGELDTPTPGQERVITAGDNQVVVVQGPPGTGKTGGAMAPALVGRCAAGGDDFAGIVVGPSNKAIDEALADTVTTLDTYQETVDDGPGNAPVFYTLEAVQLYRVTSEPPAEVPDSSAVQYVDYHDEDDDAALRTLAQRLGLRGDDNDFGDSDGDTASHRGNRANETDQVGLTEFGAKGDEPRSERGGQDADSGAASEPAGGPTLVFVTPTRLWNLLENLLPGDVDDEDVAQTEVFDLLAVDEGSMLEVPQFLLAGAPMRQDAQVLVSGDQRQLPPVQTHEWTEERRQSIVETVPYLSALDYLRFLRGDDVLTEDFAEAVVFPAGPDGADIRFEQLATGWRFGSTMTEFLSDHIYDSDGLPYEAGQEPPTIAARDPALGEDAPVPETVGELLDGSASATLLVYDDGGVHQMINEVEALLTRILGDAVPPETQLGVVTPHNAQRGRVSALFDDHLVVDNDRVDAEDGRVEPSPSQLTGSPTVETVERFQGDQRELMIVSGTVSDPEFISQEARFLLNLNRINVALSRHVNGLVLIAARSLFQHIPGDVDEYDEARLWPGVAEATDLVDHSTDPIVQTELGDLLMTAGVNEEELAALSIDPENVVISGYRF